MFSEARLSAIWRRGKLALNAKSASSDKMVIKRGLLHDTKTSGYFLRRLCHHAFHNECLVGLTHIQIKEDGLIAFYCGITHLVNEAINKKVNKTQAHYKNIAYIVDEVTVMRAVKKTFIDL